MVYIMIKKFFKQLFCKHNYKLNRWHRCHGPNGNDTLMIQAEYICEKCEKNKYNYFKCVMEEK